MDPIVKWFAAFGPVDKIGVLGSIASIVALLPIAVSLARSIFKVAPERVRKEFWFTYKFPTNLVLTIAAIILLVSIIVLTHNRLVTALVFALVSSLAMIALSFFLRQNRSFLRKLILHCFDEEAKKSGRSFCAIKFDIDLLVALNDYSFAVGHQVFKLAHSILYEHMKALKARGIDVTSVELPESDEVIWMLPKTSDDAWVT